MSRTFAIVLLSFCTILACSAQVATEDMDPESYRVYSALLSAESARLASHGPLTIRNLTDRADADSKIEFKKCFAAVDRASTSAIEDFKDANRRRSRLQNQFEIKPPYEVTDDLPASFLELSAVGFDHGRTVAIVSLAEVSTPPDSSTVEGHRVFYLFRKEHGIWTNVANGCRSRFAILVNVPVEPILEIKRK